MDYLRIEDIKIEKDFIIKIALMQEKDTYIIAIDGVEWLQTQNEMHAAVLFELLKDHVTQYVHYEKVK